MCRRLEGTKQIVSSLSSRISIFPVACHHTGSLSSVASVSVDCSQQPAFVLHSASIHNSDDQTMRWPRCSLPTDGPRITTPAGGCPGRGRPRAPCPACSPGTPEDALCSLPMNIDPAHNPAGKRWRPALGCGAVSNTTRPPACICTRTHTLTPPLHPPLLTPPPSLSPHPPPA